MILSTTCHNGVISIEEMVSVLMIIIIVNHLFLKLVANNTAPDRSNVVDKRRT